MSNHNSKSTSPPTTHHLLTTNRGFTLVEMLIIAPIVILVIGIFVSAIITMTGDVLAVRGKNALAFNIQDALNRIDQDVKVSGGYLATNNVTLTLPQGLKNDNITNFYNVQGPNADATNGTMLILNSYATTANPLSSARNFVYTTSPNACNSALVSQNQKVATNIVYFVKNNALWRRVIAPSNYATAGCSVPWQQPTCAPGYVAVFCKTQDIKLVDGVSASGFVINYYTSAAATTPIANAVNNTLSDADRQTALQTASSINVTISATKTLAGRDVSQSGTIRSSSPIVTANPITAIAAITGTPQVGQVLTAGALTPLGATASYQWQSSATSGGTYTNISGATSSTYTLVSGDVGKYIKVVATGTGSYSGSATSAATTMVAADPWYSGIAATALAGKHVYKTDLGSTYQYKTANTAVASPQGATGLDPNWLSMMSLVSPQTNPGVDFSAYPAQNACKAIGGRLPNMQELLAIYDGQASYGNNFQASGAYWSSTESDTSTGAYYVNFSTRSWNTVTSKTNALYVRCVSG